MIEDVSIHWFEARGKLHIGETRGKPGRWIAYPLCKKHLSKWIGFSDLKYAKTTDVCVDCAVAWFLSNPFISKPPRTRNSIYVPEETSGGKKD